MVWLQQRTIKMSHAWLFMLCGAVTSAVGQNANDYLAYGIPPKVQVWGPINTKKSDEKWISYFLPATATSKKILVGRETYKEGKLISRELYKQGKRHGVQREWHLNGQLSSEGPFKEGVMHGVFKHWDEAGCLVGQYQMIEGGGTRRVYNSAGLLVREESVVNGLENGLSMHFDSASGIISLRQLVDGRSVGTNFRFFANGQLHDIVCGTTTGQRHGPRIAFSEEGSVLSKKWYVKDTEVTEATYAAAVSDDPSLPLYLSDAVQYKRLVDPETVALLQKYRTMPPVRIPLEFDRAGNPIQAP